MSQQSSGAERREFFRVTGTVFLAISDHPPHGTATVDGETLDLINIQLDALQQRIEYDKPTDVTYWRTVLPLLRSMQAQIHRATSGATTRHAVARRQVVNISGSGLQTLLDQPFTPGSPVYLWLSFPAYPFATITTAARVIRSQPLGSDATRWHVAVEFSDISEADRELVIKFVNHVARTRSKS